MSARWRETRDWDSERAALQPAPPTTPAASCLERLVVAGAGLGSLYLLFRFAAWGLAELLAVIA